MRMSPKKVKIFKIKNRRGYAALCSGHLTEGRSVVQAYDRMIKALKRNRIMLGELKAGSLKKLVKKA